MTDAHISTNISTGFATAAPSSVPSSESPVMETPPPSVFSWAGRWRPGNIVWQDDGALEILKWIAALFMVMDHANILFFDRSMPLLSELGRMAFPLFAMVFAVNLSRLYDRPGGLKANWLKGSWKLLLAGAVAAWPFLQVRSLVTGEFSPLPLNILFGFFLFGLVLTLRQMAAEYAGQVLSANRELVLATEKNRDQHQMAAEVRSLMRGLSEKRDRAMWRANVLMLASWAVALALVLLVEYSYMGLAVWGASWLVASRGLNFRTGMVLLSVLTFMTLTEGMAYWHLGALLIWGVVALVSRFAGGLRVPHVRHLFLVFYPLHLWVLWLASKALAG